MDDLNEKMQQINRRIGQRIQVGEREVAKKYARVLLTIRAELAKNYEKYEKDGTLSLQDMLKHDRLSKMLQRMNFILKAHYKDIGGQMENILGGAYTDGYERTAWAVETSAKTDLGFSSVRPESLTNMLKNPVAGLTLKQRLERQRANIIYQIQQQTTQGLQKNETYAVMAKRLKNELEGDTVKAMRIVRTEGHRVQESGKFDAMDHANNNGVVMMKQWNILEDERVRHRPKNKADHKKLNNKKIPIKELFDDGLSKGLAPGQLPAAASSINCRCFLTYSVEKIEKPQQQDLENMEFETWKKEHLATPTATKAKTATTTKPKAAVKPVVQTKPKVAAVVAKPKATIVTKAELITTKAKDKFKQLITNIKTPKVAANRKKFSKELLDNAGLSHFKIGIKKLRGANGMVEYKIRNELNTDKNGWIAYADTLNFSLSSEDKRADRYKYKTLFHEFYHANMHNLQLEPDFARETEWEETATELSAHYMIQEAGIDGMVIPSYANHLLKNLPRLKQLDEFKDAESIEDFGAIFMKYRFDDEHKTAAWRWLDTKVANKAKKVDYFAYFEKNYHRYILDNWDECIADVCEGIDDGGSNKNHYLEWAKKQVNDGMLYQKHTSGYDMAILWAMKKMGVKMP